MTSTCIVDDIYGASTLNLFLHDRLVYITSLVLSFIIESHYNQHNVQVYPITRNGRKPRP